MSKSRTYSDTIGQEVLSHFKNQTPVEKIAAEYGVTTQTIRNWRKRAGGHEQRVPIASRRSTTLREIPQNVPEFLRTERAIVQGQLDHIDSMIDRYTA